MYIPSKFDMLEWCKTQGKTEYWDVFVAGMPTMGLPAADAFHKRMFNTAKQLMRVLTTIDTIR